MRKMQLFYCIGLFLMSVWFIANPNLISLAADDCQGNVESEILGSWTGADWGTVEIKGVTGTYSSTYRTGLGRFSIMKLSDRTYRGVWGESQKRHGTFTLIVSRDWQTISVNWKGDEDCEISPGNGGSSTWKRK